MPLNIKINNDYSQSVYNSLSKWSTLTQESNRIDNEREERSSETREVLFEKFTPFVTLKTLNKQRKQVIKNWEKSGLLSGLRGLSNPNVAQLFESQSSHILNEVQDIPNLYNMPIGISSRGFGEIVEEIKKKTIFIKIKSFFISLWNKIFRKKKVDVDFSSIAFPMVQRVFPQTIACDLVSVQSLATPKGLLFYFDTSTFERENVYSRVVLIEKYKPIIFSGNDDLGGIFRYYNEERNMVNLDDGDNN